MFGKYKKIAASEKLRADGLQDEVELLEKQLEGLIILNTNSSLIRQILDKKFYRENNNLPCTFVCMSMPMFNQIKQDISGILTAATSKRCPATILGMKVQISSEDNIVIN